MKTADLINELYLANQPLPVAKYHIKIIEPNYRMPFNKTKMNLVTDAVEPNRLARVLVYMKNKAYTNIESLVIISKGVRDIEVGDVYQVQGKMYNIDGQPLIGYFKSVEEFIPAKVQSAVTKYKNEDIPIPLFRLRPSSKIKEPDAIRSEYKLKNPVLDSNLFFTKTDLSKRFISTFCKQYKLEPQKEFEQIKQYINYPIIQIVNGSGVRDNITEGLLDYLTNNNWYQAINLTTLNHNFNTGPQVIYYKDAITCNPDLPIIVQISL